MTYDVVIIGGGVTGTAIAWQLSRYDISILLVDRCSDFCEGTSKANSGIVHAGYDPVPGTLKARLNIRGNSMIRGLKDALGYDFVQNGAMVVAFSEDELPQLEALRKQGVANGVPGIEVLSKDEILRREPNLSTEAVSALFFPTSGIICPFSLTYAFWENAQANGASAKLGCEVRNIEKDGSIFRVDTSCGTIEARSVVNAAGVYADRINNMISPEKFTLVPRRGEYVLLDKTERGFVNSTIFQMPTALGKGVLVTPTAHGNILVGPDSVDIDDKERTATDADALEYVMKSARKSAPGVNFRKIITSFSGLRAHPEGGDFIIDMPLPGFVNAAGIESPGLTSSPAIGEMAGEMIADYLKAKRKSRIIETRKPIVKTAELSPSERKQVIAFNPLYGNIVCRCEEISEGEIVEAIKRGATTLDGVKRRVRAGMGRCQGGFCTPRVMEILSRELGVPMEAIRKNDEGSEVLV